MRLGALPLLFSSLLLVGCADEVTYLTDAAFSEAQASEIDRAAGWLNGHTARKLVRVYRRSEADYHVISARVPGGWRGHASEGFELVRIDLELTPPELVFEVAKHEFGHALGMGHTATGFMFDGTSDEQPCVPDYEWTPDVTEECIRAGACSE